jgi:hypothetical protein
MLCISVAVRRGPFRASPRFDNKNPGDALPRAGAATRETQADFFVVTFFATFLLTQVFPSARPRPAQPCKTGPTLWAVRQVGVELQEGSWSDSMRVFAAALLLTASRAAAIAQPYPAPPIVIYAPPPNPFLSFFGAFFGIPAPMVPDGAGGFVPFTNSRVMPDGSLRPYDPAIDGPFLYAPPQPYYPPLAPAPRHPRVRPMQPQFDQNGIWKDPNPTPAPGSLCDPSLENC